MKLTQLKEEIIAENDDLQIVAVNEAYGTRLSVRNSKGGMLSGLASAAKANPGLATLAGGLAVAGLLAYNRNKRNTIRLFAKDYRERETYKKIVADLMKTGGYKKVKEKHASGGYMWELKRR